MPGVLVFHQSLFALSQDFKHQTRNVRLIAKFFYGSEDGFEVEDDGTGQRQATEGLPIDPEVHPRQVEIRMLDD